MNSDRCLHGIGLRASSPTASLTSRACFTRLTEVSMKETIIVVVIDGELLWE